MGNSSAKINSQALHRLMGIENTKTTDGIRRDSIDFVNRFSRTEIESALRRIYTKPTDTRTSSPAGIISYLEPVHRQVGELKQETDMMRALAPEIEQSRILVSSSIMSPNDLQDGKFTFIFDDIPGIDSDPDLKKSLGELYDSFYNNTLKLGIKSYDWIGEIQYSSGSKPILILPQATVEELRNREKEDALSSGDFRPSFEALQRSPSVFDVDYSWENIDSREMCASCMPAIEHFITESSHSKAEIRSKTTKVVAGLEDMIVNLRTRLREGELIRLTDNPEVLRMGVVHKEMKENDLTNKLLSKYAPPIIEPATQLRIPKNSLSSHPTIIELPSESVIPIHVPGAPSEHLGYFILLDSHGQPLTIEESTKNMPESAYGNSVVGPAYDALFGKDCVRQWNSGDNTFAATSTIVFQQIVDQYIRSKMKGIFGRDDLEISRFNSVSTMMFYRILEQKKTAVLFVPTTLLHYFAFSYDKNGIGISKLKDIQFLLSLRTVLMLANVVAMANDAVEHKKISFTVDEKNANIEGLMEAIMNTFAAKNRITGSIDPTEILRDLQANAVTLVPKSVPGIEDLDIQVDNNGTQSNKVDNDLLEQLNNLIISHLDVPPSALNQMSEPEFARSIISNNLFFAKKISRYQRIWCSMMEKFIRQHSKFDLTFQKALRVKLSNSGKRMMNDPSEPKKVKAMRKGNPNKYKTEQSELLRSILSNVKVQLPSPNMAVDSAHFEDLRNITSGINDLAELIWPQELVPDNSETAREALPIVKAMWKQQQCMNIIQKLGSFDMVELPSLDEIDPSKITDFLQVLHNLYKGIENHKSFIIDASSTSDEGSYDGDSYGGDNGDFGDDLGGDGDFGDDNMGDDSLGEEEPSPSNDESEKDNQSATMRYVHSLIKK